MFKSEEKESKKIHQKFIDQRKKNLKTMKIWKQHANKTDKNHNYEWRTLHSSDKEKREKNHDYVLTCRWNDNKSEKMMNKKFKEI